MYECKYKCWSRGPWLRGGAGCRDNGDITHWCGNPAPGLHQLQQGEGKLSAAWLWCRAGLGRGEHKKVKVWLAAAWAQRPGPGEPSSGAATFHFLLPAPCWSWAVAWSWCQGKECQQPGRSYRPLSSRHPRLHGVTLTDALMLNGQAFWWCAWFRICKQERCANVEEPLYRVWSVGAGSLDTGL